MLLAATIKLISNSVVGRLAFLGFTIWLARTQDETAYSSILFLYSAFMFFAWLGGGGFYLGALRSYRIGAFVLLRHLYLKKLKIAIIAIVSLFIIYLTFALPSSALDHGTAPILTRLLPIVPLAAALPFVVLTRFHVAQLQYEGKYFYSGFIQFSGKTLVLIACFSILFFPMGEQVIATFSLAVFFSSAIILFAYIQLIKMFASSMTIMRKIYRSLFVKILSPLLLQALAYRFFFKH